MKNLNNTCVLQRVDTPRSWSSVILKKSNGELDDSSEIEIKELKDEKNEQNEEMEGLKNYMELLKKENMKLKKKKIKLESEKDFLVSEKESLQNELMRDKYEKEEMENEILDLKQENEEYVYKLEKMKEKMNDYENLKEDNLKNAKTIKKLKKEVKSLKNLKKKDRKKKSLSNDSSFNSNFEINRKRRSQPLKKTIGLIDDKAHYQMKRRLSIIELEKTKLQNESEKQQIEFRMKINKISKEKEMIKKKLEGQKNILERFSIKKNETYKNFIALKEDFLTFRDDGIKAMNSINIIIEKLQQNLPKIIYSITGSYVEIQKTALIDLGIISIHKINKLCNKKEGLLKCKMNKNSDFEDVYVEFELEKRICKGFLDNRKKKKIFEKKVTIQISSQIDIENDLQFSVTFDGGSRVFFKAKSRVQANEWNGFFRIIEMLFSYLSKIKTTFKN